MISSILYCNLSYGSTTTFQNKQPAPDLHKLDKLDLNKANWPKIKEELKKIEWKKAVKDLTLEGFNDFLQDNVSDICSKYTPAKGDRPSKPSISRDRAILTRRKKKLTAKLQCLKLKEAKPELIQAVYKQKLELELAIRDQIHADQNKREKDAISKIKLNPKAFFSYSRSFCKTKSGIGPLTDSTGNLQSDPKIMSELLQAQYKKAFSIPRETYPPLPEDPIPKPLFCLEDISFCPDDMIKAIDEVYRYSAVGPDKFAAMILKECKDELAFPLCLLWRKSLDEGIIPHIFLLSTIVPIFKKGNKDDPAKYRPVALTSHLIKVFERVLRDKMVAFMEEHNLISNNQHGFRKGRNCLSQLLHHYDELLHICSNSSNADVIYLDFAKAFDKVDHKILLQKIWRFGFRGKIYNWLKAFLTNRKQRVIVDGVLSSLADVLSGVPQGTVLGPLLFLIFIDDMTNVVKHSSVKLFADDSKLCKEVKCLADQLLLQEDLTSVLKWADTNNMQLNEDKFQVIQHGKLAQLKSSDSHQPYTTTTGVPLPPSSSVTDLGVIIDEDLDWASHIQDKVTKASQFSGWILRTFKSRDKELLMTLFNSLVRSRLEYCSPLWSPYLQKDIIKMESVQRSFTARIAGLKEMNYHERLRHLGLYSLQRRRECYIIIQIWKIWKGINPNDVKLEFHFNARLGPQCRRPKTTGATHLDTLKFNSFCSSGPALFNIIPGEIKLDKKDAVSFKRHLDTHLKRISDTPPTPGYIASNRNSLLEWGYSKKDLLGGGSACQSDLS